MARFEAQQNSTADLPLLPLRYFHIETVPLVLGKKNQKRKRRKKKKRKKKKKKRTEGRRRLKTIVTLACRDILPSPTPIAEVKNVQRKLVQKASGLLKNWV